MLGVEGAPTQDGNARFGTRSRREPRGGAVEEKGTSSRGCRSSFAMGRALPMTLRTIRQTEGAKFLAFSFSGRAALAEDVRVVALDCEASAGGAGGSSLVALDPAASAAVARGIAGLLSLIPDPEAAQESGEPVGGDGSGLRRGMLTQKGSTT